MPYYNRDPKRDHNFDNYPYELRLTCRQTQSQKDPSIHPSFHPSIRAFVDPYGNTPIQPYTLASISACLRQSGCLNVCPFVHACMHATLHTHTVGMVWAVHSRPTRYGIPRSATCRPLCIHASCLSISITITVITNIVIMMMIIISSSSSFRCMHPPCMHVCMNLSGALG